MWAEDGDEGAVSGLFLSVCGDERRGKRGERGKRSYLLVFRASMNASRVGEVSRMMVKRVERGPL